MHIKIIKSNLLILLKPHRHAINAIPQSRRLWPVGEDVALVAAAVCAVDFRAFGKQGVVFAGGDELAFYAVDGLGEGWPACAAVEFVG